MLILIIRLNNVCCLKITRQEIDFQFKDEFGEWRGGASRAQSVRSQPLPGHPSDSRQHYNLSIYSEYVKQCEDI